MLNLNRVEIIGNLTRDPELRYTPNGQAVASFAVATNRRYRDQSDNWIDAPPEYHEVVVWGKLAEGASHVLKKGNRVFVAGRLQTRSWESPDGSKRYKTELIADSLIGPDQVTQAAYSGEVSGPVVQSAPNSATLSSDSAAEQTASTEPDKPTQSQTDTEEEINIEDIPF